MGTHTVRGMLPAGPGATLDLAHPLTLGPVAARSPAALLASRSWLRGLPGWASTPTHGH